MSRSLAIAVRDFALPSPRSGSIEAHSGYGAAPQQGVEIHGELQASRAAAYPGYRAEHSLAYTFEADGWRFKVQGRVDGFYEGAMPVVEEIKSSVDADELCRRLEERPDHPYLLQLKTYAYIHYKKTGIVPGCQLVVVSSRTRAVTELVVALDVEAYEAWLARRLAELVEQEKRLRARAARRKRVAAALAFPFAEARPGQADLMRRLAEAPPETRHFLIQAPTGMGKTLGIMFPMLKEALARGAPLLYITPKNSQHRVAENAARQLQKSAGKAAAAPRALTLTAKSRICMQDEPVCNPQHCEYARDYYDKVARDDLATKLGRKALVTETTLKAFARKHQVCPYELSLDAAPAFDVVIGDYNYVIQPHGLTGRIEATLRGKDARPGLVVDEAHNLFPRANDNLSGALSRQELAAFGAELAGLPALAGDLGGDARRAVQAAQAVIADAKSKGKGGARGDAVEVTLDRASVNDASAAVQTLVARYLASDAVIAAKDPVLRLSAYWSDFVQATSGEGDAFALVRERGRGDDVVRVICCDASKHLRESLAPFAKVVGFSATLKPFDYYARLSGFELEALATAEFTSPFPKDNRKLLVIPQVSTKLRDRPRHVARIADAIGRLVAVRPGNYVAFFPSFKFLDETAAMIAAPGSRLVRQRPGMSRAEIGACLDSLQDPEQPTLLLAVQGGGLAEGVDYPGEQLIGAIIVGPALPSCDVPREILREYYERHYGNGADYAYTYPAMAKVVQAAGRVIRTETDRGMIVLMDARFVEDRYSALMPSDWYEGSVKELVRTGLIKELQDFWGRAEDGHAPH